MYPNPLLVERLARNQQREVERQAALAHVMRDARAATWRRGVAAGTGLLLAGAVLTVLF
jgi:hypothetical protein